MRLLVRQGESNLRDNVPQQEFHNLACGSAEVVPIYGNLQADHSEQVDRQTHRHDVTSM